MTLQKREVPKNIFPLHLPENLNLKHFVASTNSFKLALLVSVKFVHSIYKWFYSHSLLIQQVLWFCTSQIYLFRCILCPQSIYGAQTSIGEHAIPEWEYIFNAKKNTNIFLGHSNFVTKAKISCTPPFVKHFQIFLNYLFWKILRSLIWWRVNFKTFLIVFK